MTTVRLTTNDCTFKLKIGFDIFTKQTNFNQVRCMS